MINAGYNISAVSEQVLTLRELTQDQELPHLEGRMLRALRIGWISLFLVSVVVMLTAVPGYVDKFNGQLAHATVEQLGTGTRFFTAASGVASLFSSLLSLGLGVMLYRRKFEEPAAAALSYYLVAYSVLMAGPLEFWGSYWLDTTEFATSLQAVLMSTPTIALFALFPNGQFEPHWMRWVLFASIPWGFALAFLGPYTGDNAGSNGVTFTVVGIVFAVFILLGLYAQIYRYRVISSPSERQQTKWVVLGFMLWFLWIILSTGPYMYLTALPTGATVPWWAPVTELGWWMSLTILPLTLTIAITRFRLWNIDIVINRALVFGGLTATSITLYGLVILGMGLLFQSTDSVLIPLIATGVAVLTFQPLRTRMQLFVNRLMYGDRDDPVSVIAKLGQQLEQAATPEATLQGIAETLVQALKLPYACIMLGNEETMIASAGTKVEPLVRMPLIYQGQAFGAMLIAPRSPDESLTEKDYQLLESISRQAGAVAYNAHLTADLQQARQRLVNAREEERRRIRRDLHDGLGPQLASLTLKLDATRNLLTNQTEEVDQLLNESKTQIQDAVADIRRLVYDLRPPALDELGLMSALRERAATFGSGRGPHVQIQGPESTPILPAAVEVAVYRIVLEALNNAAQHGHASHCWVQINTSDGFKLEIEDDGSGIHEDLRPGVGITSMRERTLELGGRFTFEARPEGGTRVVVWLPLNSGD